MRERVDWEGEEFSSFGEENESKSVHKAAPEKSKNRITGS